MSGYDYSGVFEEIEKGTVASIHVAGTDDRCPRCGHQMIKSPVGNWKRPPTAVAYISDCPNCLYSCVFGKDLVRTSMRGKDGKAS